MIAVRGLRVVLPPDTVALYGVDLDVAAGEFVMIIGRSGAGKTTFLRSLNRLVEPAAGTVQVDGLPVTGAGPAALRQARRRIGMIFQQFNLVRRASVLDNVLAGRLGYVPEWLSLLGRFPPGDRAIARDCLAQVGLDALADRRADTLSGGEQQRVAIARALAQAPSVILGDEPTASLDVQLQASIMGLLRRINAERRLTLVVSQHQLDTALEYGTRIVAFRAGRIVFDGPPARVTPAVVAAVYGGEDGAR
jgi:phosphonate transport system ATP-binding protein